MKKFDLQSIMSKAHEIYRTATLMFGEGVIFGECLKDAWREAKSNDCAKIMHTAVCGFEYTKKDGSTRFAVGTLRPDLLPQTTESGNSRRANDKVQIYYDLEKQDFRCYIKQNFVRLINVTNL